MKQVIIIHGWGGNPNINWFPWLKFELEKSGVEVSALSMPNSENPIQEEWVNYIDQNVSNPDKNIVFVGHSLGCIAILRYLENLSEETKIAGIVLVSGFAEPIGYAEPDSFCETPVNFKKIKSIISSKSFVIHSDNDAYISNEIGSNLQKNLGSEFIVIHNGGHLTGDDGFREFPLVLSSINKLLGV